MTNAKHLIEISIAMLKDLPALQQQAETADNDAAVALMREELSRRGFEQVEAEIEALLAELPVPRKAILTYCRRKKQASLEAICYAARYVEPKTAYNALRIALESVADEEERTLVREAYKDLAVSHLSRVITEVGKAEPYYQATCSISIHWDFGGYDKTIRISDFQLPDYATKPSFDIAIGVNHPDANLFIPILYTWDELCFCEQKIREVVEGYLKQQVVQ